MTTNPNAVIKTILQICFNEGVFKTASVKITRVVILLITHSLVVIKQHDYTDSCNNPSILILETKLATALVEQGQRGHIRFFVIYLTLANQNK